MKNIKSSLEQLFSRFHKIIFYCFFFSEKHILNLNGIDMSKFFKFKVHPDGSTNIVLICKITYTFIELLV